MMKKLLMSAAMMVAAICFAPEAMAQEVKTAEKPQCQNCDKCKKKAEGAACCKEAQAQKVDGQTGATAQQPADKAKGHCDKAKGHCDKDNAGKPEVKCDRKAAASQQKGAVKADCCKAKAEAAGKKVAKKATKKAE